MRNFSLFAACAFALLTQVADAEWDAPGSRAKPGQGLYANKPNQFGGHQYAGVPKICADQGGSCTGTAYVVDGSWCGTVAQFTGSVGITVTLPSTTRIGCNVTIEQDGAGQVTVSAGSGASLHSKGGFTKTSGQYAVIGVGTWANAGGQAAEWILIGDGA